MNQITNGYPSAPEMIFDTTSASVDASFPLANMLDSDPTRVTRVNYANSSGALRSVVLRKRISAGSDKTLRVAAALNVRLPPGMWSSCLFASWGADLVTGIGGFGSVTPTVCVPVPGTVDRFNFFAYLAADFTAAAYVEFYVRSLTGSSGYFEIGHLWAGPALVWSDGIDGNWKQLLVDDSVIERYPGGSWSTYSHPTHHGIELSRSLLTYEQAIGNSAAPTAPSLRSVLREVGTSKPVIMIPRTASQHELQTLSVYGLIQGPLPSIDHQGANRYATGLRIW